MLSVVFISTSLDVFLRLTMYLSLFVLLALAAFGHGSPDLCANTKVLKRHLLAAFDHERNHEGQGAKDQTYQYIKYFFHNLQAQTDAFTYDQMYQHPVNGTYYPANNAIFIVKGSRWGTESDSISLMGAHYDSFVNSPGVCDNGAGMTTLLEVARAVAVSPCARLNTVIFVAFDFEEYYLDGSYMYVEKELVPKILKLYNIPANNFKGAYIMDTVMNYDDNINTQHFPEQFGQLFPDATKKVEAHNNAGDFLASIGREDDRPLMDLLQKHWNGSAYGKKDKFRVIDLNIPYSGTPLQSDPDKHFRDLYRSDHYNFWNYTGDYTNVGLKAVFLTDTADFRGYMQECYHHACDDSTQITRPRLQFMATITDALTNSFLEMSTETSQCRC